GDAPVLELHVRRHERLAVPLDGARVGGEVARVEAPRLAVPVDPGAAEAGARKERPELPDRERRLAEVVAERPRLVRRVLEQLVADRVAQLVVVVLPVLDAPLVAALEREHVEAGLRQLGGEDAADPPGADDADVDLLLNGHYFFTAFFLPISLPWRALPFGFCGF